MKEMNKWQIKAAKENAKRIASGELTRIADRAIAAARATIKGSHTIDASEFLASDSPITRYQGQQMDGYVVSAKISAKVELESAAREICKIGKGAPEAMAEWNRIESVMTELGLNE